MMTEWLTKLIWLCGRADLPFPRLVFGLEVFFTGHVLEIVYYGKGASNDNFRRGFRA